MSYNYLNNYELDKALKLYMDKIVQMNIQPQIEEIPVQQAVNRVTAEAVFAKISSPHYNACAMDGVAVCARSTFGATDTSPVSLREGVDFIRVDTGDPLPDPFDAVVMIEDVIEVGEGAIKLMGAAVPWQHVRQIGEDLCAGEMVLPCNTKIEAAAIGAFLAGGVLNVKVWKKPIVGVIPTGDEIVMPTGNPAKGEIIEFNSSIFSAILEGFGAVPKVYPIVPDRFEEIVCAIRHASTECDIVIINAGSSAGREDFSAKAIDRVGEVFIHGIAIKPGKPTILGLAGSCPVIGVPGYPVSGMIVMEEIVKKVLSLYTHSTASREKRLKATLTRKLVSSLKYQEFVRMKLGYVGDRIVATPLNRGAGVVTSFVKADGILEVPMNSEGCESGAEVEIQILRSEEEIRNTLTIIGSHDPLIDIAADLMRRKYPGKYISSAHVGSMGGIMAVKRGEAHAAGIHLLDEVTGEYNDEYIKKYLGKEDVLKVRGVRRIQGFMVAPGNPKGIHQLNDLCREGIRYVNRQKGSGTRILLDFLLKRDHLNSSDIYGYEREEFTHMSVAALVAAGSADAGLGILAAARVYNLDFIPVCEEQYDFIIPKQFIDHEIVQCFLEILESDDFKTALEELGGYRIS